MALETAKDEPAESVAERLAQLAQQTSALWLSAPWATVATASEGTLRLPLGSYFFAGTECGLGIPPAPTCLTCNYNASSQTLVLRWRNPPAAYDSIRFIRNWHNYDHRGGATVLGTSETYTLDLRKSPQDMVNDLDVWLVGVRNGVPSNAAAMHVNNNVQEELFGIPFTNGTAPNWTSWSLDGPGATKAEMATRANLVPEKGRLYNPVNSAQNKPYQQVIRIASEGSGVGGVARTFLGLTPGHTYKVTVRLSTMQMHREKTDWSYSFHGISHAGAMKGLTPRQMAGMDALPDGSKGLPAAQAVQYDATRTTSRYTEAVTQMVLPEGNDSITIWLRFTSKKEGDAVAMDNIKLEDLGEQ